MPNVIKQRHVKKPTRHYVSTRVREHGHGHSVCSETADFNEDWLMYESSQNVRLTEHFLMFEDNVRMIDPLVWRTISKYS